MPTLELTAEEWAQLTQVLADQPWKVANPILYKMATVARAMTIPAAPNGPEEGPFDASSPSPKRAVRQPSA